MNIWRGVKIRLRGIEPEDAETFYTWDSTETETARMVDWVWPAGSLAQSRQWAEKRATEEAKNDEFFFAVEAIEGILAGIINTHSCDRRVGCFKYGVSIAPAFRGRGYAAEAVLLVLRYFFDELHYQKVTADVYAYNLTSTRFHERLGFVQEGRIRRVVFSQGQHFDMLVFGMTVEEFRARYPGSITEDWLQTCFRC
ncbi:MAG: GNAT family N-acetyltransferase [Anaerolineae bacterium]|nr:GNAT family N-acetyltransferase [Anaerolineae bacterium]